MSELKLIDKEKFKADCEAFKCKFDIDINQRSYYISYLEFLEHFSRIAKFEKHDVIIGIHLIYGWMPTICHLKSDKFDKAADILNKVKNGKQQLLEENDLNTLKNVFNNSIVGTSKLLHFISPETYPIWDGNVCYYLTNSKSKANDVSAYLDYAKACREVIGQCKTDIAKVKKAMKEFYKGQDEISDMRAVELVMFTNGQIRKELSKGNL